MKEHYCSICGHPEPSVYEPHSNVIYTCSRCVQKLLKIDETKSNDRLNKVEMKLGGSV